MKIETDSDDSIVTVMIVIVAGICLAGFLLYRYKVSYIEQGYVQIQNTNNVLLWVKPTPQ